MDINAIIINVVKYVEMERQSTDVMMGIQQMEMVVIVNVKLKLGGFAMVISSHHYVMSSVGMEGLSILLLEDAVRLNVMMVIFKVVMDALILAK